ncbi:OmpA family protein [Sphingobacterium sp. UT-1RO-CII-1]|uniref:OmpA family protein n=1 Tax=Sphingobacterium sp. UT-1RO-CII-1 TaxID=2995225 RepID=UPI00227CCA9D|nr:OmpA family protein [Sphingobacterium sp. UT-1RO-CII-1]MCY4778546.1 OmpA family protein [Sphingobacterium sp. UT-1RO-CII-1]
MQKFLSRKIIFLFFTLSVLSFSAYSQATSSEQVKRDTVVIVDENKFRVSTNPFWDNWFIGASGGGEIYFGDHNKQMKFGERIGPVASLYTGKWFTPGIGARLLGYYGQVKGATQNHSYSTGEIYDASQWLEKQKFSYYQVRADVMFDFMNLFGGYNEDRVYALVPYVGLGFSGITDKPKRTEVTATGGFLNRFRVSRAVDFTLEVQGTLFDDAFDGELGGRKKEGAVAAMLGIAYKFNRNNWDKPQTTVIRESYDDAVLNRLREQVAALSKDNDALRNQLANAKSETVTELVVENKILAAPLLVTFPINSSKLSNEARVNLGFFAKIINSGASEVVYNITGYADQGTGNDKINTRLSKERAEAVYKTLAKEFGVSEKQLRIDYKGGVGNMYYDDPKLSRAVLTIAD